MNYTIARKKGSGAIIWSEDQKRYIINEYVDKDRTLKDLAQEFHVQPQAIRNLLRKNKITITNKKIKDFPRKSDFFENIDTHEKAYWLGMLLSDGTVSNKGAIVLSLRDKEHIEKFRDAIGAVNKISTRVDNKWSKPCIIYTFSIRDQKMASDLKKYGMVPNKTHIGFSFPDIDERFQWDFIRGYFDGGGSIYWTNNKYIISIVGQKDFLNAIKKIFGKEKIALCQNSVSKITYDLKIAGKKDVKRILTKMYETSTENTRLNRKYKYAMSALSNNS